MARKVKNVALDRAQEKAKKQKRLAIILCSILGLILVYEVPHTMKLMHPSATAPIVETSASTPAAPNPTDTTPAPTTGPPPVATPAVSSAPTPSVVAFVQATPDTGQLTDFANFASKDPFLQSVQKTGGATAPSTSTPKTSTGGTSTTPAGKTGATPPAPPAPPPTSAVISVNGELSSVNVAADFPTSGTVFDQVGAPLFHLVSLTRKSAKVTIAGGSYADGAAALTLTVGQPVTLQNTADGTRYTLLLEPQGTPVPPPPTSTTPASTTPTTTTPASIVPSGSGG
jgi:hypothetical protein